MPDNRCHFSNHILNIWYWLYFLGFCFFGSFSSKTMAIMFSANKSRWHSNMWSLHFPALSNDSPLQCKQWNWFLLMDPVERRRLLPCPRYTIWHISSNARVTWNRDINIQLTKVFLLHPHDNSQNIFVSTKM